MTPEKCSATYGRETPEHCFITVTQSSDGLEPYRMCSKCGVREPMTPDKLDELEALLARLELLAAWWKPAGPEPKQKMPPKFDTITAAYSTIRAQAAEIARMRTMGQFLCDRIGEMDWSVEPDEFASGWHGHVEPALCRFRDAIGDPT